MVSWSQKCIKQVNDNGDPLVGLLAATLLYTPCNTVKNQGHTRATDSHPTPLTSAPAPHPPPNALRGGQPQHIPPAVSQRCFSPPLSPPGLECIRLHALHSAGHRISLQSASAQWSSFPELPQTFTERPSHPTPGANHLTLGLKPSAGFLERQAVLLHAQERHSGFYVSLYCLWVYLLPPHTVLIVKEGYSHSPKEKGPPQLYNLINDCRYFVWTAPHPEM